MDRVGACTAAGPEGKRFAPASPNASRTKPPHGNIRLVSRSTVSYIAPVQSTGSAGVLSAFRPRFYLLARTHRETGCLRPRRPALTTHLVGHPRQPLPRSCSERPAWTHARHGDVSAEMAAPGLEDRQQAFLHGIALRPSRATGARQPAPLRARGVPARAGRRPEPSARLHPRSSARASLHAAGRPYTTALLVHGRHLELVAGLRQ